MVETCAADPRTVPGIPTGLLHLEKIATPLRMLGQRKDGANLFGERSGLAERCWHFEIQWCQGNALFLGSERAEKLNAHSRGRDKHAKTAQY